MEKNIPHYLLTAVQLQMTTHANHRIWQDVYHGWHSDMALYIKFQQAGDFFVVSFKEL